MLGGNKCYPDEAISVDSRQNSHPIYSLSEKVEALLSRIAIDLNRCSSLLFFFLCRVHVGIDLVVTSNCGSCNFLLIKMAVSDFR